MKIPQPIIHKICKNLHHYLDKIVFGWCSSCAKDEQADLDRKQIQEEDTLTESANAYYDEGRDLETKQAQEV